MKKTKKHFKKKIFNKTFKMSGGFTENEPNSNNNNIEYNNIDNKYNDQNINDNNYEKVGTISLVQDALKDGFLKATNLVKGATLNALGLQEKNPSNDEYESQDQNTLSSSPGIFGKVSELANRTGATVVEGLNNVLENNLVKDSLQGAAEKTADSLKENLEVFNDALNNPQVKEQVVEAISNAGVIGNALVQATKEPLNNFAENVVDEIPNLASAAQSGLIKVGTDIAGAIPGLGAGIDMLRAANDGARAFSNSVEAVSNMIDAGADLIKETTASYGNIMKELEKNKELARKISDRTNASINEFTNPLSQSIQAAGKSKTRRRLFKQKAKSKRVRFSF